MKDLSTYLAHGSLGHCSHVHQNNGVDLYTITFRDKDNYTPLFLKLPSSDFERGLLKRERDTHFEAACVSDHVLPLRILPLYDTQGAIPHVATEIQAGALDQRVHELQHRPHIMASLLLGACRGLADIHRADIVHRDVKPENIAYDHEDRARLIDFGTSVRVGHASVPRVITPMFYAPEIQHALDTDTPIRASVAEDYYAMARTIEVCLEDSLEFFKPLGRLVHENKNRTPEKRPGLEPLIAELTGIAR